jgi:UDP-N-acetylmuramoyl-tripeptide--D-alanyl-D-alanine ligase
MAGRFYFCYMGIPELYQLYKNCTSVQTDTRTLKQGDLFFALKGDRFNGNRFAAAAIEAGAAYAVIDEKEFEIPGKTILVDNTLETLQQLSKFHREQFSIPFLGITGSNGKTTTKELIHAVLSSHFRTYTTEGNLNNQIGIPLTILMIKEDAAIAVVEMGANHQREIASYCLYALPTHGMITNCGKAHLEGFGGVEGVKKGKGELFDHLRSVKGTAFVMWDYDYLREMSKGIPHIITYGTKEAGLTGEVAKQEPFLQVQVKGQYTSGIVHTNLVGDYNLPNVLAAVAIGEYFKVPSEKIFSSIASYTPSNNRSQLLQIGTNTIIMDAYNANPSSMKLAIENFMKIQGKDKVLMIGAMAELGDESLEEHQAIIKLIGTHNWKAVALTGGDFQKIDHPYLRFDNAAAAAEWYKQQGFENTHILIKGSRSMQMEKIIA